MRPNVIKLPNVPALLTVLPDETELQLLYDSYVRNIELTHAADGHAFWIIDLRDAVTNYESLAACWIQLAQGLAGASILPSLKMAFLVRSHMTAYFDLAGLIAFTTLDEAIDCAERELGVAVSA